MTSAWADQMLLRGGTPAGAGQVLQADGAVEKRGAGDVEQLGVWILVQGDIRNLHPGLV